MKLQLLRLLFGALLTFFPFLFFSATAFWHIDKFTFFAKESLEFGLFSISLYALGFLLLKNKARMVWFLTVTTLLYFIGFIKSGFYILFQAKLNSSAFYVVLETTKKESADFFSTYFSLGILFTLLLFIGFLLVHYRFFIRAWKTWPALYGYPKGRKKKLVGAFLCIAILGGSAFLIQKKLKRHNFLYLSYDSYTDYHQVRELFQSKLTRSQSEHFTKITSKDTSQTYVVVLGESTSSRNMGLYGYYRNTTPLLSELTDDLLVFQDVIAPHTHTIPVLNKVLTLANYEQPRVASKGSILQLANAAGFKTYWLSNQQPIGINETLITAISKAADEQVFTNAQTNQELEYDEVLLPHLQEALEDPVEKKLVFIHLSGTHLTYKHTYPDSFSHYTDAPKTKFPSERSTEQINEYDNAVRYNDYIVRKMIDQVKAKDTNAWVLYFSDHGDEVYQDIPFVGHSEYQGSKPMYEVPFVLWTSDSFRKWHPNAPLWKDFTQRKYMTDDLFHSLTDLAQIRFAQWEAKRSVFHPGFKPRKRVVKNNIDYDQQ